MTKLIIMSFLIGYVHPDQRFELMNQVSDSSNFKVVYTTPMQVGNAVRLDLSAHVGRVVCLSSTSYQDDFVWGAELIPI